MKRAPSAARKAKDLAARPITDKGLAKQRDASLRLLAPVARRVCCNEPVDVLTSGCRLPSRRPTIPRVNPLTCGGIGSDSHDSSGRALCSNHQCEDATLVQPPLDPR